MTWGTGRIFLICFNLFQVVNYWQQSALGEQHRTTWKRLKNIGYALGVSSLTLANHPQSGRVLCPCYSRTASVEHFRAQCRIWKPFPCRPSLKKLWKDRKKQDSHWLVQTTASLGRNSPFSPTPPSRPLHCQEKWAKKSGAYPVQSLVLFISTFFIILELFYGSVHQRKLTEMQMTLVSSNVGCVPWEAVHYCPVDTDECGQFAATKQIHCRVPDGLVHLPAH